MTITENYSGIDFNIEFNDNDKICLFLSPSGTGKTFLFTMLNDYLKEKGYSVVYINSTVLDSLDNDIDLIQNKCLQNDIDIVILDNADLYISQEFLNNLLSKNKKILISIKVLNGLRLCDFGKYKVIYSDDTLSVRRKKL